MTRTRVGTDQFQIEGNEVVHLPTGARWTAYSGRAEPHLYSPGTMDSVLPNGEEYWRDDAQPIAIRLLADRPEASAE